MPPHDTPSTTNTTADETPAVAATTPHTTHSPVSTDRTESITEAVQDTRLTTPPVVDGESYAQSSSQNDAEHITQADKQPTEWTEEETHPRTVLTVPAPLPTLAFYPEHERVKEEWEPAAPAVVPAQRITPVRQARFGVGLSYAREFNTVNFSASTEKGWKAGLHLDYRLGQHWSLGLGGVYSVKEYMAGPNEYKRDEDIWVDGIAPYQTYADCEIIEIPLTLRYFQGGFDKPGWFGAVGLHSFFMKRETFTFYYHNPPPGAYAGWEERGTNRHLLRVAQLQAGYQLKLGRQWGLQVAPYLQIPLAPVGHGKVNVQSLGLQLQMRWWP